ncbi:hypothetical protein FDZ73_23830, partial [bacterium]
MDFKTRDLYRKEVEKLSAATGCEETELAEAIVSLARSGLVITAADPPQSPMPASSADANPHLQTEKDIAPKGDSISTAPGVHIGEVLLGNGRATLERQIGYQPDLKTAFKRWVDRHAEVLYITIITFLSLLIMVSFLLAARLPELLNVSPLSSNGTLWSFAPGAGNAPLQWIIVIFLVFAFLIPALSIATSLVNWLITLVIRPRILPKLNFKNEIPAAFKTLVVIPAIISNTKEIESLVRQLEQHYLGNREPGLVFALLSDFQDADSESFPEDEDLLQTAATAIEALNQKYAILSRDDDGGEIPENGHPECASIFYFLHRRRLWNPSERKWMGWERKRGKLHELNQLLRGGDNLSFMTLTDRANETNADLAALRQVRY